MAGKIPETFGEGRMKFSDEDLSNQNKIRSMLYPGSTISHALIQPDEGQKKVMKHKYDGTSEWNWHDPYARKAAAEYDNHPEVLERRWKSMPFQAKVMCMSPSANMSMFYVWNAGVALAFFRLYFSSFRTAFTPWIIFCGAMGYHQGLAPELA